MGWHGADGRRKNGTAEKIWQGAGLGWVGGERLPGIGDLAGTWQGGKEAGRDLARKRRFFPLPDPQSRIPVQ